MDMVKYIIKRLLLSVLILIGVSIIIYALARMMPTDYVDNQYSSAVAQGTMRQEDVDRIKDLYGLSMPDAYLKIKTPKGGTYGGLTFTKQVKQSYRDVDLDALIKNRDYEISRRDDASLSDEERVTAALHADELEADLQKAYTEWYTGSYDGKKNLRLILNENGTFGLYEVFSRGAQTDTAGDDDRDTLITLDERLELREGGTWRLIAEEGDSGVYRISCVRDDGTDTGASMQYKVANGWNKFIAIMKGYFSWFFNMLRGDLGMSFKYKKPVKDVIFQNMGISFAIAFVATVLQFAIAIPLGIRAARNQYGVIDYSVTVFSMIGISLPTFFLAALVIRLFAVQLGWFEVGGIASSSLPMDATWIQRLGDNLWHMVLPMFVLVILSIGSLMRYTRTNTLEALNADYVRTARAKGLPERAVINKHAFRNTMIPLVTLMAGILPSLFGGAMITETVFSIPGIGKLAYDALVVADVPFIMGYNIFIAVLTIIGTLLSDLMYAVVDPRVKLGR